ncbi:uncharacterized protein LOC116261128 [Nymphaea colorata]|nr:uncharacterized protein LOC116261128 [Nymphaea colorata]
MALLLHTLFRPTLHHAPPPLRGNRQSSGVFQPSPSPQPFSTKSSCKSSRTTNAPALQRHSVEDRRVRRCLKMQVAFKDWHRWEGGRGRCSFNLIVSCSNEEAGHSEEGLRSNGKCPSKERSHSFDSRNSQFLPIEEDKSTAPFLSALKAYAERNAAGFTFPGHNRGMAAPSLLEQLIGKGPFRHDLAELDNFFSPEGAILEAQKKAAELFGATETWFLVGGTTCGVEASIMSTCSPGDTLILPRNSHISAISGMVLSGALPKYMIPEYNTSWGIADRIKLHQVAKAIDELHEENKEPAAVFITSPTYHGICSDLEKIIDLCHKQQIPVIIDEAHGAHFKFDCRLPSTALEQGADLVIQSTHKVLCSLSQSSMLHLSSSMVDRERISRCLQTLQSTSPSYLLLASLDATRAQLSKNPYTIFDTPIQLAHQLADEIQTLIPNASVLESADFEGMPRKDPLRVTIDTWKVGVPGYDAYKILREEYDIIPELRSQKSLTFAVSLGTCREHIQRVVYGIKDVAAVHGLDNSGRAMINHYECAPFGEISIKLSPREAFFASKRRINVEESLGEICGELICTFPPGIPVLIPGEVITQNALSYLINARDGGAVISGAADSHLHSIVVCDT